ncbi:hypothetical protein C8F01DRAFT_1122041 [Mycena amicta]|nr:hypothetical protein C8F01DRAFT_1122041 [Mycena amicta]
MAQPLANSTNLPTPPSTQNPPGTEPDVDLAAENERLKIQLTLAAEKNRRRKKKTKKRKRSPSPSDDDQPAASRRRTSTAPTSANFHDYGRTITRTQGSNLKIEEIILHGLKVDTDADYDEREESTEARVMTTDFRWLCERFPGLHATLLSVAQSLETIEEIADQISTGMDAARNEDRNRLRTHIMAITKGPTLTKDRRGFRNPHTAALLLPLHLVHRAGELSLHDDVVSGAIRIVAEQLPSFLFPAGQENDRTALNNLLTGETIIQAAKVIYHGPSAMGEGDGCRGRGKDGNAELVGLKSFTPRLIAYLACQVRFALSSVTTYNKVDGEFDYDKFYNYVLKALRRKETEERVIALFNRRVLGVTPGDHAGVVIRWRWRCSRGGGSTGGNVGGSGWGTV